MLGLFKDLIRRRELDCKGVRELFSDYLDDDLPPASSTIQSHLSKCGPYQAFVDTLASTISILARLPRVSPPASFKRSILNRARGGRRAELFLANASPSLLSHQSRSGLSGCPGLQCQRIPRVSLL